MDRRKFIRHAALAGVGGWLAGRTAWAETGESAPRPAAKTAAREPSGEKAGFSIASGGRDAAALAVAAVAGLGGMKAFVKRGDVVVIKPNIGWDRGPLQAANTNPDVVAALVRECLKAEAKKVIVTDNTCNDAQRCFVNSEIERAAKEAGAEVRLPEERRYKEANVGGEVVKLWLIDPLVLEADVRINVPVAKHHGLSGLTLGMKNWFGAVGGARNRLHQDVFQSSVDLAAYFKPHLVVLDAYRMLLRNGPQGGNPRDVKFGGIVAASTDQVAIDAYGSTLFGFDRRFLANVVKGEKARLGTADYEKLGLKTVDLSEKAS